MCSPHIKRNSRFLSAELLLPGKQKLVRMQLLEVSVPQLLVLLIGGHI